MTRGRTNISAFPGPKPAGHGGNGGNNYGERLARIEEQIKHMVTQEDVLEINVQCAKIEEALKHTATRSDVADVKALLERQQSSLLRWFIATAIAVTIAAAAVGSILASIFIEK